MSLTFLRFALILLALSSVSQYASAEKVMALHSAPVELAAHGGGSDGGGFLYYYTSGAHFKNVKNFMARALSESPEKVLKEIAQKYEVAIDWNLFATVIKKAKSEPTEVRMRKNPDGDEDFLLLDYNQNTKSITALKPFFELFNKEKLSNKETFEMMRLIAHEVGHIFGIGINKNDQVARQFGIELAGVLARYWFVCENEGLDIEKIQTCNFENSRALTEKKSTQVEATLEISYVSPKDSQEVPATCNILGDIWRRSNDLDKLDYINRVYSSRQNSISNEYTVDLSKTRPGDKLVFTIFCQDKKYFRQLLNLNPTLQIKNTLGESSVYKGTIADANGSMFIARYYVRSSDNISPLK